MRLRAQNPREREPGPHSPISRHDPYVIKGQSPGAHPSDWILLGYTDSPPQPLSPPEQLSCSSVICVGKEAIGVHHGLRSGFIMVPGVVGHHLQGGIVPPHRHKQIRLTKGSGLQWTAQVHLGLFHPDPATTSAARPTVTSASCEPVQLDCSFSWTISGILFWCLSKDTEMRVESALHLDSLSLEL